MNKRIISLMVTILLTITVSAERREVHILVTNDMHASIGYMPQLAAIVDSLRSIDPNLLVFSAGDNRTGDPLNDKYEIPAYPMVALMNLIGFNASAIGNHEFDSGSLQRLIGLSSFRYLCANIIADDSTGIHAIPSQIFYVGGVKVGVIGAIQVGSNGIPSSHPDNLHGIRFVQAADVLGQYETIKKECDATILLSHLGYFTDVETAEKFPWLDVILGGHTHKQLTAEEPLHHGVLITQCGSNLRQAAHVTLTIDSSRVVDKKVEYIHVRQFPHQNEAAAAMVRHFSNSEQFSRVIAQAATPFTSKEELACMMCDAYRDTYGADIALTNPGGVRISYLPKGNITVLDVLKIDPFDNKTVVAEMTGRQLKDLLMNISHTHMRSFPFVSGINCKLTTDANDSTIIKKIQLFLPDGKPLKMNWNYKVVTNNYIATTNEWPAVTTQTYDDLTNNLLVNYLEKKQTVSYQGVRCLSVEGRK